MNQPLEVDFFAAFLFVGVRSRFAGFFLGSRLNFNAAEFMQYRNPVGRGPSLKT